MTPSTRVVRLALVFLLAAACTAGAAGCGASAGDAAPPTTSGAAAAGDPTAAEQAFLDQANEICRVGTENLDELSGAIDADSSTEELERFLAAFVGNIRGQLDAIAALDVPASLAPDVEEFVQVARKALDRLEERGTAALVIDDEPFAEVNEMALDLGLTACGAS